MTLLARQAEGSRSVDGLTLSTLLYLAVPNLIFAFGWFRLSVALFLSGTLLFLLVSTPRNSSVRALGYTPAAGLLIVLTGFTWAAFGGGSHFMYANHDWVVRDAVLADLVHSDWPVIYKSLGDAPLILRSAIGYFLPPALFGKLFGTAHIDIAIYLWTVAGVLLFLALLPLPKRLGWPLILGLLVTVFFSGMDFLGLVIATQSTPIFPLRLEWWVPLSYPSLTGQLLWAPNHCLPIWIGTLLIFRHRNTDDLLKIAAVMMPLTLIWTPFAAAGLIPFVLLGAWESFRRHGWRIFPRNLIVAGAAFSVPICLFLLLDAGNIAFGTTPGTGATAPASISKQGVSLQSYLIFISCEFLLLTMALSVHVRQARSFFAMAILLLLALPLFRLGPSNDLLLRLSTPPLIILLAICLQTLLRREPRSYPATLWLVWAFLAIGAHTAFNELWRSATFHRWKADYWHTLADREGGQPAPHYVGRLDTSLVGKLLKSVPK